MTINSSTLDPITQIHFQFIQWALEARRATAVSQEVEATAKEPPVTAVSTKQNGVESCLAGQGNLQK